MMDMDLSMKAKRAIYRKKQIANETEEKRVIRLAKKRSYERARLLARPDHEERRLKKLQMDNLSRTNRLADLSSGARERTRLYDRTRGRKKKLEDPIFLLKHRIRSRLGVFMKSKSIKKRMHTYEMIGCSWDQAKQHLENNTRGLKINTQGVEIDHIRPFASFKNIHCEYELKTACHFLNLQLLPSNENNQKRAKFDYDSWAASDSGKQLLELNRKWRMEKHFE
jgi:hypothetical protein